MVGRVFVLSGPHTGKRLFVLDRLNVYEVGKASGSHIKLHDASVAMNHCRFYRKGEEYTIYALSESSPTTVNDKPVKKHALQSGDVVKIGATELVFELVTPEHADIPPVISDARAEAAARHEPAPTTVPAQAAAQAPPPEPVESDTVRARAASAPFARILVLDGEKRGVEFSLTGKEEFKIGRSTASDVRLQDAKISRNHCLIESRQGSYVIIDLESANGTIVNGEKIKKATLKDGDFVRLGFTMLKFELVK